MSTTEANMNRRSAPSSRRRASERAAGLGPSATTRYVCVTLFAAVMLLACAKAMLWPAYNWDLVAYVGCVHLWQFDDPQSVHDHTYGDLRAAIPTEVYESLTADRDYHAIMANDPRAFVQQLGFYRVKPLYVMVLYLLVQAGLSAPLATMGLSAASYFALAMIGYLWIQKYVAGFPGLILAVVASLAPPLLETAALATPDMFSAALLVAGFYLYLERHSPRAAYTVFILSILARPDNIVLLFVMWTGLRWLPMTSVRMTNVKYAAGVAVIAGSYLLVNRLVGGYGWRMLFEHTFVGFIRYPAEHVPEVSVLHYAKAVARAVDAVTRSHLLIYFLPIVVGAWLHLRGRLRGVDGTMLERWAPVYLWTLYLIAASTALRLIIHPAAFDRFFVAQYALIQWICVALVATWVTAPTRSRGLDLRQDATVTA